MAPLNFRGEWSLNAEKSPGCSRRSAETECGRDGGTEVVER
jgi:hypothetical protein